jgi:hypothetical protein
MKKVEEEWKRIRIYGRRRSSFYSDGNLGVYP